MGCDWNETQRDGLLAPRSRAQSAERPGIRHDILAERRRVTCDTRPQCRRSRVLPARDRGVRTHHARDIGARSGFPTRGRAMSRRLCHAAAQQAVAADGAGSGLRFIGVGRAGPAAERHVRWTDFPSWSPVGGRSIAAAASEGGSNYSTVIASTLGARSQVSARVLGTASSLGILGRCSSPAAAPPSNPEILRPSRS